MASATGIPQSVVAAQANAESGFNATAVSSAGAEGWLQFLPSTYDTYAAQAGVAPGTEFNPADEAKVYDVYMKSLLQQEGGSLRNALAAYNAGPGNLAAGYGYADSILSAAGTGNITVKGSGTTPATLTGAFGIPGLPTIGGSVSGFISQVFEKLFGGTIKDLWERGMLIVLGFALVIVGIKILSSGTGKQAINIQTSSEEGPEGRTTSRKIKTPVSEHKTVRKTVSSAGAETGAEEAAEAAAVA